jgi:adenosylhomocysteinase
MSHILDPSLAPAGARKIDWAAAHAPVMRRMRERMIADGSVRGRRIGVVLALEPKTAFLAQTLADAGAEVSLACNASMTADDVAAALATRGVEVFARSDATPDEERDAYAEVLARRPEIIIDDMAELIRMAHTTHAAALDQLTGATEETTSGVVALRAMAADGALRIPCIAANDARCKQLFDNRYGSGQSVMAALMDTTNLLIAGTVVLVVGYGWVGHGLARVARGLGARVVVAEIDPVAALEAHHDGHDVAPVAEACTVANWVITATGCRGALGLAAIESCRDGTILANAGGPADEIDVDGLRGRATQEREVRPHVVEFGLDDGRSVFLVGDGRCVNLSAGEGHPIEIMDLTFAVQGFSARHLALHAHEMTPGLHQLPGDIDDDIAREKLADLGLGIDTLTPAQHTFLADWQDASSV